MVHDVHNPLMTSNYYWGAKKKEKKKKKKTGADFSEW